MKCRWPEFVGGIAAGVAMLLFAPTVFASTYDLVIGEATLDASGTERPALAINGSVRCHLMYHMATGMFREVVVEDDPEVTLVN